MMLGRRFRHLVLLAIWLVPVVGPQAQTVIKMGTIAPEGSVWNDTLLAIRQKWRDISGGQVELRIYAGGVLGGEDEMVRKMQRRSLDALAVSGAGLTVIDDIIECLNVPLLFDSYDQLDEVRRAIAPELERSFETRGYKVLSWAEAGWVHFFAKAPVRTPDDLRRQRLWTSTGIPEQERLLKELGLRVVPLPATDMLTGLQTGLIEAIDVPPLFALLDRSYEVADYMTVMRFAPLNAAIVMTVSAWQRVPAEFREAFLAATLDASRQLRQQIHQAEEQAIEEMARRGLHLVELDDQARAEWKNAVISAYPQLPCNRDHPDLLQKVIRLQAQAPRAGR